MLVAGELALADSRPARRSATIIAVESTHFLKVSKPLYRRTLLELQVRQLAIASLKLLLPHSPEAAGVPLQAAASSFTHWLGRNACTAGSTMLHTSAVSGSCPLSGNGYSHIPCPPQHLRLGSLFDVLKQALLLDSTLRFCSTAGRTRLSLSSTALLWQARHHQTPACTPSAPNLPLLQLKSAIWTRRLLSW